MTILYTGIGAPNAANSFTSSGNPMLVQARLVAKSAPNAVQLRVGSSPGAGDYLSITLTNPTDVKRIVSAPPGVVYLTVGYGETAAGQSSTWENISVREVTAITQATTANKPTLKRVPILGPELVADPSFDDPSKWTLTQPTSGSVTISGGDLTILSTDGSWANATAIGSAITAGKTYRTTMTVKSHTGGQGVRLDVGGVTGTMRLSAGYFESTIVAAASGTYTVARGGGIAGSGGVVSDVSVREILGYTERYSLEFDGVNDYMSASSAATLSDGLVLVWAGKLFSNVVTRRLIGLSASTDAFAIRLGGDGLAIAPYLKSSNAATIGDVPGAITGLGQSCVVTAKLTTSAMLLRVNSGSWFVSNIAIPLSGATMGAYLGSGYTDGFSNQSLSAAMVANLGANATDANIAILERAAAQAAGITL